MPQGALKRDALRKKTKHKKQRTRSKYPENVTGRQICIAATEAGVKIYGNRQAFQSLANWMSWLAKSPEREHYECHLKWHFQLPIANRKKPMVWALLDRSIAAARSASGNSNREFDVTFMMVENHDLLKLRDPGLCGLLPDDYVGAD